MARALDRWKIRRDLINSIVKDLKWLIAISLLFTIILYQPEQIRELYRAMLGDGHVINSISLVVPMLIIAAVVWFGSFQLLTRSLQRADGVGRRFDWWAQWLPALLGAAPLLACAAALLVSVPDQLRDAEVVDAYSRSGSPFKGFDQKLAETVGYQLSLHGAIVGVLGLVFLLFTRWAQDRLRVLSRDANEIYFCNWGFLGLTVAGIATLAICFLFFPVSLPQTRGPFGIIAAFVVCVTGFAIHFSLLTIEWRAPIIPIVLVVAFLISYFDLNDNHSIRTIDVPQLASSSVPRAGGEFLAWLENRPNRASFEEEYPVYIIAAQGGGIYAAHQTALFLARMQDVCPSFRNHLFAISSVSGGSVGAAMFAAAVAAQEGTAAPAGGAAVNRIDPCPKITDFLQPRGSSRVPNVAAGPLEQAAAKALSRDFLSPLIAATLFADFTQRFVPYPIPSFDRARALEFAIEEAATAELGKGGKTLLDEPFPVHWNARGAVPALLMNTTDAGSGRRVLLSPFAIEAENARSSACSIVNLTQAAPTAAAPAGTGLEASGTLASVRLSTAAVMSARFPWVTPAATVHVDSECLQHQPKVRLVDGGYVDNSGIETALDLIVSLEKAVAAREQKPGVHLPRVRINLIVLSGGGFSERGSFALGETLEPIRALLSTRASRAYVALDRANRELPAHKLGQVNGLTGALSVDLGRVRAASLVNLYYPLPLGWAMSAKTHDIIALQSGHFWNCEFDPSMAQSFEFAAQTDCIQLLTYHEMNQSLKAALGEIAIAQDAKKLFPPAAMQTRLDHESLIACYAENYHQRLGRDLFRYQAESIKALLRVWDASPSLQDSRWLAFILATAAHESADFRLISDLLMYSSVDRLPRPWRKRFVDDAEAEQYLNRPEHLANRVYGYPGNPLGNAQPGDGWRYRGRGLLQIVGRENYRKYGRAINVDLEAHPEALLNRDIAAKVMFSYFIPSAEKNSLALHINDSKEDWLGARKVYDPSGDGADQVIRRGKLFTSCIENAQAEAKQASR